MERPEIENLKAKMAGRKLNKYQEADAYTEYRKLYTYLEYLEKQLTIYDVVKQSELLNDKKETD